MVNGLKKITTIITIRMLFLADEKYNSFYCEIHDAGKVSELIFPFTVCNTRFSKLPDVDGN